MSIDHTTIVKEPGLCTFGGETFYSKSGLTVEPIASQFGIDSDMFGKLEDRDEDRLVEIKFTPVGEFEALAVLNPFGSLNYGASLFGATDSPLVVVTKAGRKMTVENCAVTSPPSLTFAHNQTIFGEVTMTGLVKNNTEPSAANSYFTAIASGETYPTDATFNPANILTLGYKGVFGTGNWDGFGTETGFSVSFDVSTTPTPSDGLGTIDMTFDGIAVTVTAKPQGVTQADVIAAQKFQGTGNALGARQSSSTDLNIINREGGDLVYFRLYDAILANAPNNFSSTETLIGEVSWKPSRKITAGTASPLFYIGTAAPV